ncbi:MauE/DoxX family redox-associated membrane protein [Actinomadura gamaensis]|uniref:MauE/DoxX family redox-associated membrane protein n=1 Tax=Actinomadura gamaensis TaxID=1763541 RepID=A0ABV9U1H5_9ACTN
MGTLVLGAAGPALVAVLAAAALGKLRDPRGLARAVSGYRLVPPRLAAPTAWAVIVAEIAVAALVVLPPARRLGSGLAAALFLGLLLAQVSVLRRGLRVACGCFGRPGRTTLVGPVSVARTSAMLTLSVMTGSAPEPARGFGSGDALGFPVSELPLAFVYVSAVAGLGLVLRPGPVPVRRVGEGGGRGPRVGEPFVLAGGAAAQGETTLFALVAPTCGTCLDALPAFAEAAGHVRVVVVTSLEESAALRRGGLPVIVDPDVFDANGLPLPPYAVLADASGTVLTAGPADSPERLAALLHEASAVPATTTPTPPAGA